LLMKDEAGARALIFSHIPKTAGTTLRTQLIRQYPADAVFSIEDADWIARNAEFAALPEAQRRRIRCLIGHVPFGIDRLLPQGARYITMMRDPVDWTLSLFTVVREREMRIPILAAAARQRITLEAFPAFLSEHGLANLQTRFIAGEVALDAMQPPYPPLSPGSLEHARSHLDDAYVAVGLVERFDESALLMQRRCGWRSLYYRYRNRTPGRRGADSLSDRLRAQIEACHDLDMRLYAEAGRRLEQQLAAEVPDRGAALRRLRWRNRAYTTAARLLRRR